MTSGRAKGKRIGPIHSATKNDNWLYEARHDAHLTIDELAEISGVSSRTIKRIEAGEPCRYSIRQLKKCLQDLVGTVGDRKK